MTDRLTRARRALAAAGLPRDAPLERANSYANETWLGDRFVLRVNWRGDIGRLRREVELAARLPAEALHPGVLDHGSTGDFEWLLLRRIPGVNLSRAWPELDPVRRERAARELASALRAMHGVDAADLPGDADFDPPHVLPLDRLLDLLASVKDLLGDALADETERFVRARWSAFDRAGMGLVHGDPHLENVLWDGEHVSALLDLDWSRRSWLEVDLEILLDFCHQPHLFVASDDEDRALAGDYADVPGWLESEYPGWFAHSRLGDRLDVLNVSRLLGSLHDAPPTGPMDPSDPRVQLAALLTGRSFLARFPAEVE